MTPSGSATQPRMAVVSVVTQPITSPLFSASWVWSWSSIRISSSRWWRCSRAATPGRNQLATESALMATPRLCQRTPPRGWRAALQAVEQVGFHQPHLLHMAQQRLAGRRGAHLLAAHQQALAQRVFERLDAQRHGGQRDGEGLGGRAEATVFDHGVEGFELAGVEHGA